MKYILSLLLLLCITLYGETNETTTNIDSSNSIEAEEATKKKAEKIPTWLDLPDNDPNNTNAVKDIKLLPVGTRIMLPAKYGGTMEVLPRMFTLYDYDYSTRLTKYAHFGLQMDLMKSKLLDYENLIEVKNKQIENLNLRIENYEKINTLNLNYMKATKDIFGDPTKNVNKNVWMLPVGIIIGVGATLLAGGVWAISVGQIRPGN